MRIYQMAGLDGFTNPAAFLGEASPLMASGTFVRSGLTGNIDLLTRVYRENWLARRIIDTPAEDMTRAWYSLATGKSKEDLDELARLEAPEDMRILFEPVKTMGATEQVKLAAEHTRMVLEAFEKGIISKGEALDELKGMSGKTNIWAKLEGGEMHGEGQQDG